MPGDIVVDSISDYRMRDLNRLKAWLLCKRTETRIVRERAERRQKKEEEAARKKGRAAGTILYLRDNIPSNCFVSL